MMNSNARVRTNLTHKVNSRTRNDLQAVAQLTNTTHVSVMNAFQAVCE